MSLLDVRHLSVRYGALTIVDDASFSLDEGEWLMIVGPNGAGKSTILNAISQGTPYAGEVLVQGRDIKHLRARDIAKSLGVLSQSHAMGYGFTVGAVVRLGRYAYAPGLFSGPGEEDEPMVARALELTGMTRFADQNVLTLSGGELQRTFLAQLFAQNPSVLLLDEPTNHLDLVYQKQVFELIAEWVKTPGRAVVSVVHDLSLARAYGTHGLLLDGGKTVVQGKIDAVFAPEHMNSAYAMDVPAWMRRMLAQWKEEETR
jgi:iron complex transport system ATP-binding protein